MLDKDELWLAQINFLISIGRITPRVIDGQEGWIVPSAREWCTVIREKAKQPA